MNEQIINYINSQKIGVLAVEMPDGAPHAATIHYAFASDPIGIYVMTARDYRKCEPIIKNGKARASFVAGTNEQEMKTIQMDGEVKFADPENFKNYFAKFPEREAGFEEPDDVILHFTPSWWRYTDFKSPQGKLIISSED